MLQDLLELIKTLLIVAFTETTKELVKKQFNKKATLTSHKRNKKGDKSQASKR